MGGTGGRGNRERKRRKEGINLEVNLVFKYWIGLMYHGN